MAQHLDPVTGRLDGATGLTSAYRDYNLDGCDAERLVEFVTVTSAFYPELRASYDEEAGEWLAKRRRSKQDERTDRFLASASSYQHWLPGAHAARQRTASGSVNRKMLQN